MVAPVRSRPASSPSAAGAPHESQRVEVEAFAEGTEERRARRHAALKVVAVDVAELTESADLWRAPVRLRLYTPRPRGLPVWTLDRLTTASSPWSVRRACPRCALLSSAYLTIPGESHHELAREPQLTQTTPPNPCPSPNSPDALRCQVHSIASCARFEHALRDEEIVGFLK